MYLSSSSSEESLRSELQTLALNHHMTMTFEDALMSPGREETITIMSSM